MRYEKLDALRGITFISMFIYHALWDVNYIFGYRTAWYSGLPGFIWQQSICITFIALSGFCLRLGSHGVRRGILVSLAGAAVTAFTWYFVPDDLILFGVLTLIGASMLIQTAFRRSAEKFPSGLGFVLFLFLFIVLRHINLGYIGIWPYTMKLPGFLYSNTATAFLGFPPADFYSTDYFSLLPWFCLFAAGFYLCGMLRGRKAMKSLEKCNLPFLKWIGRHSLLLYLLHQPVIYVLLSLILTGTVTL